ncbi:MAG: hypothetical protein GQ574_09175 [Crocinitomix sp.]|nr:hypothetical protein [Crocinitomix sp.]
METIKRKDFNQMTYEKRLVLPWSLNLFHSPFYLMLAAAIFALYLCIRNYQIGIMPFIWLILGIILFAFIGIARRDQKRNFKTIPISLKRKRFKFVLTQVGQSLKWDLENVTQDYIIAHSICPKYKWKRRVTILRTKDAILVNMICIPHLLPLIGNGGIHRNYGEILEKNIREITERDMSKELQNLLG